MDIGGLVDGQLSRSGLADGAGGICACGDSALREGNRCI